MREKDAQKLANLSKNNIKDVEKRFIVPGPMVASVTK